MPELGVLYALQGILVLQVTPHNLLGFPKNLQVPTYTPRWREALREFIVLPSTQCSRPRLEPVLLDPGTSALTMKPQHQGSKKNIGEFNCQLHADFYIPAEIICKNIELFNYYRTISI